MTTAEPLVSCLVLAILTGIIMAVPMMLGIIHDWPISVTVFAMVVTGVVGGCFFVYLLMWVVNG